VNDLDWAVSPDGSTIRPLKAADRAALTRMARSRESATTPIAIHGTSAPK
jgi:hypothetical protein